MTEDTVWRMTGLMLRTERKEVGGLSAVGTFMGEGGM